MGKWQKRFLQVLVTLVLLALGVFGMQKITASRQEVKRRKPPAPVPTVRVMKVETRSHRVIIEGEGTVRSVEEIKLVPQVGGNVTYVSPALVNGGRFSKGDVLVRIDPVDYELAVTLAQAKVKDGESRLQIAREESAAAREEWRLNHPEGSKEIRVPPPLVAKEPQLAAARAMLEAYRADLKKARLNLERTALKAPFDGRVTQENVGIGQFVAPGQVLATLYSTEAAEVVVHLEDRDAFWFHIPGFSPGRGQGAAVRIIAQVTGRTISFEGRVVRVEGKIDPKTRMLPVVIRVERPYAKKPPLAAGLFVTARIQGVILPDSVLIPRSSVRQDNIVWIADKEGHLRFRRVDIARMEGRDALIRTGLKTGDRVVVSPMEAVTDGMRVRTVEAEEHQLS